MERAWKIFKKENADPLCHLAMGADRRRHLGSYYIPSLVNTGMTGAEIELMRRSPESVNVINNPANR
jgi:septin family protein